MLAGFCVYESRAKGDRRAPWIPISEFISSDCRPCCTCRDGGRCQPARQRRQEPRKQARREPQALLRQGPQGLSQLGRQRRPSVPAIPDRTPPEAFVLSVEQPSAGGLLELAPQ